MGKTAIMQPYFFPYIGYFQLMNTVDLWVAFDDTQFIDKGWVNRNRVLHPEEDKVWQFITLPLSKRGQFDKICDISLNSEIDWRSQILGKLSSYKRKAPFYNQTVEFVRDCFDSDETNLSRLVIKILKKTAAYIGINTTIEIQSDLNLGIDAVHHPGQWALKICDAIKASEYINPIGGKEIFKNEEFDAFNIKLSFLKSKLIPYNQHRTSFVPALSILDILMFNEQSEISTFLSNDNYEIL
jgi:hypothetical protein